MEQKQLLVTEPYSAPDVVVTDVVTEKGFASSGFGIDGLDIIDGEW